MFELKNSVTRMPKQEILIPSQNVVNCFEFFIGYPRFWYNQIYKPSRVFNGSEKRVYNKMHTSKWW